VAFAARCRQIRDVGGDCYDVLPLQHDCVALAGKSLPAALMISSVQPSLRTAAALAGNDAARLVQTVNFHLQASSIEGRHATLFYGVFNGRTRTLRYVNAGHNPPIVVRRDRPMLCPEMFTLETGGVPVGMFPGSAYEEGLIQIHQGDLVVAYTDGVTEVLSPEGEEWGVEGLRNAINETDAQSPDEIVSSIFAAMDQFSRGCQTGDATILVARVI
jgi:phosphoserine phosphatase RsbU/P